MDMNGPALSEFHFFILLIVNAMLAAWTAWLNSRVNKNTSAVNDVRAIVKNGNNSHSNKSPH